MAMQHSLIEQTLAFAAICQAAKMVQVIARQGKCDEQQLTVMLESIINTTPENTLAVYGNDEQNLQLGLVVLEQQLGGSSQVKDPEVTRYIVSMLALERKLAKQSARLNALGDRISDVQRQLQHFELLNDNILANFADIYIKLISPLGARIQVAGEPAILQQSSNQHKIRSLLLSGVRAAVLWRQVGGKRRNLLFSRSKILNCAKQLTHN